MKRYVSVLDMRKRQSFRPAFTLIEVMVAVMIVSVVIGALVQMQGNANNTLFEIKKMMQTTQYSSFLLQTSEKYGFEKSRIDMNALLDDFELESDLRRRLKALKVEILYEELELIDTSKLTESLEESEFANQQNSGIVFEIGKTQLLWEDSGLTNLRVRME